MSDAGNGMVLAAVVDGRIVAMGGWDRLPEGDRAEIDLTVEDGQDDDSVGAALLRGLAAAASQMGIRRFLNRSLPDDGRVRRILTRAGFETSTVYQEGVLRTTFSTVPETPRGFSYR
jgi:N-acetylglutamate synthase-like GNAT family acetyltransferase